MTTPEFNPTRLTIARKRRGLTKTALARRASLSVRSLLFFESGELAPSEETLSSLSRELQFPVDFFFGEDIAEPNPDGTSFRALTSMTAAQRDAAICAGALAIHLSAWMNDRFKLPEVDLPRMRGFRPSEAAQAIRARWGLGSRSIRNVIHLLESKGARVFSIPNDTAAIDAFSVWHDGVPYIFLTTSKSGERGRMDAAHELGHLLLHQHGGPRGRQAEKEANQFASAFLMPESSVLGAAPANPTINSLVRLKKRWGVSLSALVYRLKEVECLSEWQYRTLWVELSKLGYRRSEPDGLKRESSQVLAKVFSALRQEGTSRLDVARQLSIRVQDLDALIFGLVVISVSGERDGPATGKSKANLRVV